MESGIITLYKEVGETPLECLNRFKEANPEYKDIKLSYAGRLDPLAEGAMLVLVGEENKKRHEHLSLDKEYEIEVLFGISTDTQDVLGLMTKYEINKSFKGLQTEVEKILPSFVGTYMQEYPSYSSKTVNGKALFDWAKEGKINEIEIPQKEITIYAADFLGWREMQVADIYKETKANIEKVKGDFRQKEILAEWKHYGTNHKDLVLPLAKIRVSCSSGTYMRSLAYNLGAKLEIPALAYKIKRTKVGDHIVQDKIN